MRKTTTISLALVAIALSIMLVQAFHNLSVGVYARMIDDGVRADTTVEAPPNATIR